MTSSNNQNIVTEDDLKALSGYETRGTLKRFLEAHGIWYTEGKNGQLGTTINAIDRANSSAHEEIQFVG